MPTSKLHPPMDHAFGTGDYVTKFSSVTFDMRLLCGHSFQPSFFLLVIIFADCAGRDSYSRQPIPPSTHNLTEFIRFFRWIVRVSFWLDLSGLNFIFLFDGDFLFITDSAPSESNGFRGGLMVICLWNEVLSGGVSNLIGRVAEGHCF